MRYRVMYSLVIVIAVLIFTVCTRDFSNVGNNGNDSPTNCVTITAIDPEFADNSESVSIIIRGDNFNLDTTPTVLLGPNPLEEVLVLTQTLMTATVPANLTAGTMDLIVITHDLCTTTLPNAFTVIDPGEITIISIDPDEGSNAADVSVTIKGTNFIEDVTEVLIGESPQIPLKNVTWASISKLTAEVPLGLDAGLYDVTVRNTINETTSSDVLVEGFEVIESGAIYISAITPDSGENDVAVSVSITGRNFEETPTATLGEYDLVEVEYIDSRNLSAKVPKSIPADIYDLTVTNPDEKSFTLEDAYTVIEAGDDDDSGDDDTGDDDTGDDDTAI